MKNRSRVQILQKVLEGKYADQSRCEDALVVTETGIYAVLDGASGHPRPDGSPNTALVAVEAAVRVLERVPAEMDARSVAREITDEITDAARVLHSDWVRPPAVQMVAYNAHRDEVWQIGDCWWAFGGEIHSNSQPFDELCATMRSLLINERCTRGEPWPTTWFFDDPLSGLVDPFVVAQAAVNNSAQGDCWANGWLSITQVPETLVLTHSLVNASGRLLLASDGFPAALDPEDCERKRLARAAEGPVRGPRVEPPWRAGSIASDDRALLWLELD